MLLGLSLLPPSREAQQAAMFLVNWCVVRCRSSPLPEEQRRGEEEQRQAVSRASFFSVQCLHRFFFRSPPPSFFSFHASSPSVLSHVLLQDLLGPQLARPLQQKRQDPVFGEGENKEEEKGLSFRRDRSARQKKKETAVPPLSCLFPSFSLLLPIPSLCDGRGDCVLEA